MSSNQKRILLLSAYDAVSHRAWRERLQQLLPEYQWTQLALPARNFNWKIRGNSLIWAYTEAEVLHQSYDLLIATSMVDLSSLRGFVPELAAIPTIVYFHENQFCYPQGKHRKDNIEHQLVPLYAALSGDRIIFNSEFNRQSFLQGARNLLKKLPDKMPAAIVKKLESSEVIGVPLHCDIERNMENGKALAENKKQCNKDEFNLLWNHRWEYDKGPGLLLEVVTLISQQQLPLRFHVVGESFRDQPVEFSKIEELLRRHGQQTGLTEGEFGFIPDPQEYRKLLASCDVVLSTAKHDFQGLAIQEACMQGCSPLTPNDLVYPEYLRSEFLYQRKESDKETAEGIVSHLANWISTKQSGKGLPKADLEDFSNKVLAEKYKGLFSHLI